MLEFDKDLVDLIEAINSKNLKGYRVKLLDIVDKWQLSNTKQYYKNRVDKVCMLTTGRHYEEIFINGFEK